MRKMLSDPAAQVFLTNGLHPQNLSTGLRVALRPIFQSFRLLLRVVRNVLKGILAAVALPTASVGRVSGGDNAGHERNSRR